MNRKRQGFTLTEIALVIGIAGLILGSIWTAMSSVAQANQTKKAATETTQILNSYRSLYATRGVDVSNFTDITCLGVTAGYFPAEMVLAGSSCTASVSGTTTYSGGPVVKSPFGGSSYVLVQAYQNPQGIIIGFYNLTQAQCNSVAQKITFSPDALWESIDDVGYGTAANTQFIKGADNSGTYYQPFNLAAIGTACATSSSQDAGQPSSTSYQPASNRVQVMFRAR